MGVSYRPEHDRVWMTSWDRENRKILVHIGCIKAFDDHAPIAWDPESSKDGVYDVWRYLTSWRTEPGSETMGDIAVVEIRYGENESLDDIQYPVHLLPRRVLGYPTLLGGGLPSFMSWGTLTDEDFEAIDPGGSW